MRKLKLNNKANIHIFRQGKVPWKVLESIRPGIRECYRSEMKLTSRINYKLERQYIVLPLKYGWDYECAVILLSGTMSDKDSIRRAVTGIGHLVRNCNYKYPKGVEFCLFMDHEKRSDALRQAAYEIYEDMPWLYCVS